MACDTRLKPKQTISQRAEEVRRSLSKLNAGLISGSIKAIVAANGGVTFPGFTAADRDGITDGCALRLVMSSAQTPALVKMRLAHAEQMAGRSIDKLAIAQGLHSHDNGTTWHKH